MRKYRKPTPQGYYYRSQGQVASRRLREQYVNFIHFYKTYYIDLFLNKFKGIFQKKPLFNRLNFQMFKTVLIQIIIIILILL